jgi:hypothetical protein
MEENGGGGAKGVRLVQRKKRRQEVRNEPVNCS